MSRSRRSSAGRGRAGGRLQTIGIFLTLVAVAALVGSLAAGLVGGRGDRDDAAGEADRAAPAPLPAERIRVEVLNASGVPGLAAKGRTVLRDRGFDVVYVGNARGFGADTSVVLDRVGRMELARGVADELGITRVVERPDSNVYVDVTVVLGTDWAAAQEPAPAPGG